MIFKDISFPSAQENIFYDTVPLESAEDGISGEVLRFWEAEKFFVVLGKISKLEDDAEVSQVQKDGVEVIRRPSGGGTVLQGPGCLNYSLILSYEKNPLLKNIKKSYEIILNKICLALEKIDVKANFEPVSDIMVGGRKFSGNAQARKRKYMLHHGTILYDFPIDMVEKYIAMPKKEPPYRKGRPHRDFLTNVTAESKHIKQAIAPAFIEEEIWVG